MVRDIIKRVLVSGIKNTIRSQVDKVIVGAAGVTVTAVIITCCCLAVLTSERDHRKEAEREAEKWKAEALSKKSTIDASSY